MTLPSRDTVIPQKLALSGNLGNTKEWDFRDDIMVVWFINCVCAIHSSPLNKGCNILVYVNSSYSVLSTRLNRL